MLTKALAATVADVLRDYVRESLRAIMTRLAVSEAQLARVPIVDQGLTDMTNEIATLRERLAVTEIHALEPGPPGPAGVDGIGFEDLSVLHDGERGFTFRFTRGELVKSYAFSVPCVLYRGVFVEGKSYDQGDMVTWAGSTWYAKDATLAKPGGTDAASRAWILAVKAGRDGREGKAGPEGKSGPRGDKGDPGRNYS